MAILEETEIKSGKRSGTATRIKQLALVSGHGCYYT
jgi:hypothetical protein